MPDTVEEAKAEAGKQNGGEISDAIDLAAGKPLRQHNIAAHCRPERKALNLVVKARNTRF